MDAIFKYILNYRLVLFLAWFTSGSSLASFICSTNNDSAIQQSKTLVVLVDPVKLERTSTDALITDMSAYAKCNGWTSTAGGSGGDALRTTFFSVHYTLTTLGFNGYIQFNDEEKHTTTTTTLCIWPDRWCSTNDAHFFTKPINLKIGIQRSNSSPIVGGAKIPSGTEIARLNTQMRYNGWTWKPSYVIWSFVLKNDMIIPIRTCTIQNYDANVALPNVYHSELIKHGPGRYPGAQKAFKFNLTCEHQTAVSVTFNGDTLSGTGTDSVLKNKLSGNDNVGIQLLFNDSTPVKMTEKLKVATSAQPTEQLSFNAYYYYKGGNVSSGPVKANTTFTFEYQ